MVSFPVSPEKQAALEQQMRRLNVDERDLDEQFTRSRGPGGQNVNKVATCVVLRHRPSGLVVRCQRERSQALNRFLARRLLIDKLEERRAGAESRLRRQIEKIRRQKRKRSARAKKKILEGKRIHAEKKAWRRNPVIARSDSD